MRERTRSSLTSRSAERLHHESGGAWSVGLIAVAATLIGLGVAVFAPNVDLWLADRFVRPGSADHRVLVVAIDKPFLEQADRSPLVWERLIARLRGAPLVFDLELEAMSNSGVRDHEWRPVFLGYLRSLRSDTVAVAPDPVVVASENGVPELVSAGWVAEVAASASATGFDESVALPTGGVVRSVPLVASTDDGTRAVASAAFEAVRLVEGATALDDGRVEVGGAPVTSANGMFRPAFANALLPGGAQVIPAMDVVDDRVTRDDLAGSIVLVGVTDPARATMVDTPVGSLANVQLRANVISSLLLNQGLRPVSTVWIAAFAIVAAAAVAAALRRGYWLGLAALAAAVLGVVAVGWTMSAFQVVVSPLAVCVAAVTAFAGGVIGRTRRDRKQLRDVTDLFASYVPDSVARRLLEGRARSAIGDGVRLEATVLFCDLRGFTELCERIEPAEVRRTLDLYYAAVSDTVLEHGGTVVQYVGDEVFSIFGAPDALPDHAARAVACATQLLDELPKLQNRLRASGLEGIGYGIGVHTGPLVSASVGTKRRRQYGVVGSTVNTGARLCARASVGAALISDATRAAISNHHLRSIGPINLTGVTTPVETFELMSERTSVRERAQLR